MALKPFNILDFVNTLKLRNLEHKNIEVETERMKTDSHSYMNTRKSIL